MGREYQASTHPHFVHFFLYSIYHTCCTEINAKLSCDVHLLVNLLAIMHPHGQIECGTERLVSL